MTNKPLLTLNECFQISPDIERQGAQIGRFLKVLGNKFSFKSSPNFGQFWGQFFKHYIKVKMAMGTLWATFRSIIGLLFISTSGHTD